MDTTPVLNTNLPSNTPAITDPTSVAVEVRVLFTDFWGVNTPGRGAKNVLRYANGAPPQLLGLLMSLVARPGSSILPHLAGYWRYCVAVHYWHFISPG